MTPIVEGRGLTRTFPMAGGVVTALRNVSIEVNGRLEYVEKYFTLLPKS